MNMEGDPEAPGRRLFLHRLGGQAIQGAGRLAGLSGVVQRSVIAAGDAAIRELVPATSDGLQGADVAPPEPHRVDALPDTSGDVVAPSDPVRMLTTQQIAFLQSVHAGVLAVNESSGGPHQSRVLLAWDDGVLRAPTAMFSARANAIARDPRVSLLIEAAGDGPGRWVAIVGIASLEPDPGDHDLAVIVVRPTRFAWHID